MPDMYLKVYPPDRQMKMTSSFSRPHTWHLLFLKLTLECCNHHFLHLLLPLMNLMTLHFHLLHLPDFPYLFQEALPVLPVLLKSHSHSYCLSQEILLTAQSVHRFQSSG